MQSFDDGHPVSADSSQRACAQCGKLTGNPKFCDQSCAATYNAAKRPKRRPEGRCERCGTAIFKRLKFCNVCKEELEKERERRAERLFDVRRIDGSTIELRARRVVLASPIVFKTMILGPGNLPLDADDCCGDLIDLLLGIIYEQPDYLRAEDGKRLASLLVDLSNFVVRADELMLKSDAAVSELPIKYLSAAARLWVNSWMGTRAHPLMATYAINAVEFLEAHVAGYSFRRRRIEAEIAPIVAERERHSYRLLDDPQFKKEITENIRSTAALIRIPDGCQIISIARASRDVVSEAGSHALFRIDRCHLSSGLADVDDFEIVSVDSPRFDFCADFLFRGEIVFVSQGEPDVNQLRSGRNSSLDFALRGFLPIRWIVGTYRRSSTHAWELEPVPRW